MNRQDRRKATRCNRGMLVTASLAAGSLFGYVGYTRPAFANIPGGLCTVSSNDSTIATVGINQDTVDQNDSVALSAALVDGLDKCLANASISTINFDQAVVDRGTVIDVSTPFAIDRSLTIQGASTTDAVWPVFDGGEDPDNPGTGNRLFISREYSDTDVTFKELGFRNAYSNSQNPGGALYFFDGAYDRAANLTLDSVHFYSNTSESWGGAVYTHGDLIVQSTGEFQSLFFDNRSGKDGGAIYSYEYLDVSKSTFKENKAGGFGGAVYTAGGLKVSTSLFVGNKAEAGGAVNTMNSSFKMYSSTFRNNIASGEGGVGVSYFGGAAIVRDSLFEGNKAYGSYGGALYTAGIDVSGSSFIANYTAGRGGSIYSWSSIDIKESVFYENKADKGGAIFAPGDGNDVNVINSTFYKNSANQWGAIGGDGNSDLEIDFSTFYKNDSLDSLEAVFLDNVTVDNSIIAGGSSVPEDVMSNEPEFAVDDDRYVNFSLFSNDGDLMLQPVEVDGVFSHLLPSSGSPAIGGANPASDVATDQLGNERTSPSTIGAIQYVAVSATPPSFSAPVPTTSPILTLDENKPFSQGETVVARVSNATRVESVSIGDTEAEIISFEDGLLTFTVPELEAGSYSITGLFNSGTVIFDVGLEITGQSVSEAQALNVWTKKVSDTEVKVYAKNPIGNGKIQFFVDDEEIAWVRAEDSDDPKLSEAQGAFYLVRTVELTDSKQAIEIFVDGVRAWRAAYTATS